MQSVTFYSYNTLTRDMAKIYARFTRARIVSHILSNRAITVIFYNPVDETIIDSNYSKTVPPGNQNQ